LRFASHGRSASGTCTEPVLALVHLEQHGDRAAHRAQRAVERGDRRQAALAAARMPSRRAWKSVQLLVEVSSSQRCCEGSHASQSYLRAALEPEVAGRPPRSRGTAARAQ
jgi:hypothetical protein